MRVKNSKKKHTSSVWEVPWRTDLLARGERVVLGFSGGADSSALFHLLLNSGMELKICAVHVNHCLRGEESDKDEEFCSVTAKRYGCDFKAVRLNVREFAEETKCSIEEAGRALRYRAFEEVFLCFRGTKIITAHNKDDNAETIIHRFFRGTGLKGLSGIPIKRGNIIRPLLYTSRAEIMNYIEKHNIPYRTDETNEETDYTRNKIRNIILPLAAEHINQSAVSSIVNAAKVLAAEDEYLDELAEKAYRDCAIAMSDTKTIAVSLPLLADSNPAIRARVVIKAYGDLKKSKKDLGIAHVESVLKLLSSEGNKRVTLPGGVVVKAVKGALVFSLTANVTLM